MCADRSRLCLHSFTTRPWSAEECIEHYAAAGIAGITWWRETVVGRDPAALRRRCADAGLAVAGLARGGFFTAADADARCTAIATNREALAEAEALGAPVLVLVCGATPGQNVAENLAQIRDGIAELAPEAAERGVRLAIEPLHPTYAGNRSAVASLACANALCEEIGHPAVAVAVDVYHVFWEHDLAAQIRRCAVADRLAAFHICDYRAEPEHPLFDRGIMGEGVIDVAGISRWVDATGFAGPREVEIFSHRHWSRNQHEYLADIVAAYERVYGGGW